MFDPDFLRDWSNLWQGGLLNGAAADRSREPCVGLPDGRVVPERCAP